MNISHEREVEDGKRFKFGANWSRFLRVLNEERIVQAEKALSEMLSTVDFKSNRFLDAGCGSGLHSLVARKLGATVHSFDYDPQSVECTRELRDRYYPDDQCWVVEEASVLDTTYMSSLSQFDVVYSWGVLHHTGSMWDALDNVASLVKKDGLLFIAIYNDQGWISRYWSFVKQCYARNIVLRGVMLLLHMPYLFGLRFLARAVTGRLDLERGMSLWYDMIDWIGGYPFEVARPEEIFEFCHDKGFKLVGLNTCGGRHGCNEFVFSKGNC
mgnify:CR=1 FL=1|jgi:2-polyprenyl-6-hydroxyphenyl methylase/3-demethylubiquinone-9 3-methyltransferase